MASGAVLVRIARQAELPEGGKLVKESHGCKILLARTGGKVFATDAHCFHMGGNLWEGDIEDIDGHACVVCPLHRYKINMSTGQKVDTMLDGCVVCSDKQQQRTYRVYADADFICVDIPELHTQKQLPGDRYNQVAPSLPPFQQPQSTTPNRANYGLFGSSSRQQQAEPLAPYAGFQHRGLIPSTPDKDLQDEPAMQLSQESGIQLSQEAPQQQQQQQAAMMAQEQQQQRMPQGHITFSQSRVDTARIARRKAATAAIAARAYVPPSAPVQQAPAARGLFSTGPAPQQAAAASGSGLARQASGQQSLLSFGFTRTQPVTTGPEDMDMS